MRKAIVTLAGVLVLLAGGPLLGPGESGPKPPETPDAPDVALPLRAEGAEKTKADEPGRCGRIRVGVRHDLEDDPIAGARIEAACASGVARTAVTGADGTAEFGDLPVGRVRLVARAVGYADSEEQTVDLLEGEVRTSWFRLEPAGPLCGRVVVAATGRPAPGVRVTAMTGGFLFDTRWTPQELGRVVGTATTAADGRFTIEGVPREPLFGLRLAKVEASGYRTLLKVAPPDGKDDHFVIRLVPAGTIEGTVTAPGGEPVSGARIVAVLAGPRADDPLRWDDLLELPDRFVVPLPREERKACAHRVEDAFAALVAVTDDAGRYEIRGAGLGERYVVAASGPGHAPSAPVHGVRPTAVRPRAPLDLVLRKPCRLTVFCVDSYEDPWPGVSVEIEPKDGWGPDLAQAKADDRGIARFEGLTPGEFYVRARDVRYGVDVKVEFSGRAGENDLTLTVDKLWPAPSPGPVQAGAEAKVQRPPPPERTVTLRARIAVPEGVAPPEHVTATGEYPGGSGHGGTDWTPDETGTVKIEWTWADLRYRFVVSAPDFLPIVREIDRAPGTTADLGVLTLDAGETLRGVVRRPDGTPLPGVRVVVTYSPSDCGGHHPRAFAEERETAADGTFRLSGLPAETVEIEMRDPRFLPYETTVALPLLVPVGLTVRLGAVLRVKVTDEDGHPATRRHVTIYPAGEEERYVTSGRTNVEGEFRARLIPGEYRIRVVTRDWGDEPATTHWVELADGDDRTVRMEAPRVE